MSYKPASTNGYYPSLRHPAYTDSRVIADAMASYGQRDEIQKSCEHLNKATILEATCADPAHTIRAICVDCLLIFSRFEDKQG